MKKQITKEVLACDYCGEEIVGANHRFADITQPEVTFDLHAECMKKCVVEALRARKGYHVPPKFEKATCRGSYGFGTACGHCERCDRDPLNPKNNHIKPV